MRRPSSGPPGRSAIAVGLGMLALGAAFLADVVIGVSLGPP